jgi:hypothetical protein
VGVVHRVRPEVGFKTGTNLVPVYIQGFVKSKVRIYHLKLLIYLMKSYSKSRYLDCAQLNIAEYFVHFFVESFFYSERSFAVSKFCDRSSVLVRNDFSIGKKSSYVEAVRSKK